MTSETSVVPFEKREVTYTPLGESEELTLTVGMVRSVVAVRTRSGKLPSDADVMKFIMLCKARGLNPFVGDAFLIGYDSGDGATFQLITSTQALRKRAEAHPEFDGCSRGVIVKRGSDIVDLEGAFTLDGDELLGGWAKAKRKDQAIAAVEKVKLSSYSTGKSRWKVDPEGMVVKCFDEETQVLTSRGFVKFEDASGILQVTEHGLEETDAIPFSQRYCGEMVGLFSDDLNFNVTPNHDMVTTDGKIEANQMYDAARSRAKFWIPRSVRFYRPELGMSDRAIKLAAIYLADGCTARGPTFVVSVSKERKVAAIERLGMHCSRRREARAGEVAKGAVREIITTKDRQAFRFNNADIAPLVSGGKRCNTSALLALSQRQARLFVDTLIEFDGYTDKSTGVRRFYQSHPDVLAAFEIAAIQAGYSISALHQRTSDISKRANYMITVSSRSEIGVRRWGRKYNNLTSSSGKRKYVGLVKKGNPTDRVWCVSVPSGVIVVRRRGFSMQCGNCAEAAALRRLFPTDVGQMFLSEEFDRSGSPAPTSGANISRDPITDALSGPKGAVPVPAVEETSPPQDAPDGPTEPRDEPPSESDLESAGMLFQASENTGQ